MSIFDDNSILFFRLMLPVALGALLGARQKSIRQGMSTFSLISLAASTCTLIFLFAGMTRALLVQEFTFLILAAGPVFAYLIMELVSQKRMRELELLLCVVLAAGIGVTSGLGGHAQALLAALLGLILFKLLHRMQA